MLACNNAECHRTLFLGKNVMESEGWGEIIIKKNTVRKIK